MAAAVAREECHAAPFEVADYEGVGGIAEGRLHANFAGRFEAGHGVEAAAADDSDFGT